MVSDEIFPIVDLDGNVIGTATRKECHSGSKLLHQVVHLHIIDNEGRIFLQKRSLNKDIQPGKWDTAVGGHVDCGETVLDALKRETREELGVNVVSPKQLLRYKFESDRECELVNSFCICVDSANFAAKYNPDEIDDTRFWTIDEIESCKGQGVMTPNFELEFDKIKTLF